MFDLEREMAEWRREMLAAGVKTPVPLEELEIHLREEVERRMRSGTDAQQAFELAVARVGAAGSIQQEFKKMETKRRKNMTRIMVIIAALFGMVMVLGMVLPALAQWSRDGFLRAPAFLAMGIGLVLAGGMATFYGIRTHRERRGRMLIALGLGAAGVFYTLPFILALFQTQKTNPLGWLFCAFLLAASLLFFGTCFCFNRRNPAQAAN